MTSSHEKKLLNRAARNGVTLIELLVVIGLISFMAGMVMFALRGAQDDARVARTRGTITKLNDIILQQWEEYRYRAVDMRLNTAKLGNQQTKLSPRAQAHLRTLVLRDTMRMEMPDRASDLLVAPSQYIVPTNMQPANAYLENRAYAAKMGLIFRAFAVAINGSSHSVSAGGPIPIFPTSLPSLQPGFESLPGNPRAFVPQGVLESLEAAVQPSELLYLIVANSTYGGASALEDFRPSEIGDPDDDGLLEFIDAWGNPIQWIRWPAGYPSDLNRYANTDALDPLRTDWRYSDPAWPEANRPQTVVPLIVSSGVDGQYGVTFGFGDSGSPIPIIYARMRQSGQSSRFYIDPFFTWDYQSNIPNGPGSQQPYDEAHAAGYRANQLGSIPRILPDGSLNEFAADNVTNHDIILGL